MKKKFENWLIKKLVFDSAISEKNIDTTKRTINFGLLGMAIHFCDPKHHLILYVLVKWYGYKCLQEEMVIRTSFLGEKMEHHI